MAALRRLGRPGRRAAAANPWLEAGAGGPAEEDAGGAEPGPEEVLPALTGPAAPQGRGVPAPDTVDRLSRRSATAAARPWWLGAHGGAGESTLAGLLPGSRAAEHAWPQPGPVAGPLYVVLVARTHRRGVRAAQLAAADWASGGVPGVELLGLVWVPDSPGRMSREVKDLVAVVSGGFPRVWTLPWVEDWRRQERHDPAAAPRAVRRVLDDVAALLGSSPGGADSARGRAK